MSARSSEDPLLDAGLCAHLLEEAGEFCSRSCLPLQPHGLWAHQPPPILGLLQAPRLEAAISSGESSRLREQNPCLLCLPHRAGGSLPLSHGKPWRRCRLSFIRHCSCPHEGSGSYYLITVAHLQMPSHWALGFWNEEYTNIQAIFAGKKGQVSGMLSPIYTKKLKSSMRMRVFICVCVHVFMFIHLFLAGRIR